MLAHQPFFSCKKLFKNYNDTMLNYNEIKDKKNIILDDEPFEVVEYGVSRQQQRKPVNKTKLKSLITGKVVEHTFQVSDTVQEADITHKNIVYIYSQGNHHWFHTEGDKSDRFTLDTDVVKNTLNYISAQDVTDALIYTNQHDEEHIIGLTLPIKMNLQVTEAPPSIKGNTATGGDKLVTVSTGAKFTVPLFINVGDIIAVNTETGEYTERISKA